MPGGNLFLRYCIAAGHGLTASSIALEGEPLAKVQPSRTQRKSCEKRRTRRGKRVFSFAFPVFPLPALFCALFPFSSQPTAGALVRRTVLVCLTPFSTCTPCTSLQGSNPSLCNAHAPVSTSSALDFLLPFCHSAVRRSGSLPPPSFSVHPIFWLGIIYTPSYISSHCHDAFILILVR